MRAKIWAKNREKRWIYWNSQGHAYSFGTKDDTNGYGGVGACSGACIMRLYTSNGKIQPMWILWIWVKE